jgi:hypothetical protein
MLHVNEFSTVGGNIIAAYTADTAPEGSVIGRSGNAVLLRLLEGRVVVVSKPRCEGDIASDLECDGAPDIDLGWAF